MGNGNLGDQRGGAMTQGSRADGTKASGASMASVTQVVVSRRSGAASTQRGTWAEVQRDAVIQEAGRESDREGLQSVGQRSSGLA